MVEFIIGLITGGVLGTIIMATIIGGKNSDK